jgi:tRNA(Met) cytidine acetyltransferase
MVLVGEKKWSELFIKQQLVPLFHEDNIVVYGENDCFSVSIDNKNYRQYLGKEYDAVFYFSNNITPDSFAALSGGIKAGGLFVLILESKSHADSYYMQRFLRTIKQDCSAIFIEQNVTQVNDTTLPVNISHDVLSQQRLKKEVSSDKKESQTFKYGCMTLDQEIAVTAILKVHTGHRNRPLVLTADRGRGKSCALALATVHMLREAKKTVDIIVCAPQLSSLNSFFQLLKQQLAIKSNDKTVVQYQGSTVKFMPLDVILTKRPKVSLLLIDEAASFPLYLLNKVLLRYHRLVFSSTLHGYEGAGRGFALKFKQLLAKHYTQYSDVEIEQPIRFDVDDPLENFVFNACLLNASLPDVSAKTLLLGDRQSNLPSHVDEQQETFLSRLCYQQHSSAELLKNEALLAHVFSILVTAHYQTSPNDLKLMLDNPNVKLISLTLDGQVVSVALIMTEGQLTDDLVEQVKCGKRRLKDHFLPQALLTHCGHQKAFDFSYWRILRIAVNPAIQQQGIGSAFLAKISEHAKEQSIDIIGTSFGLNNQLFNFWQNADYCLARIGFTQDHASGEYSGLLLKSVSADSEMFVTECQHVFYEQFLYLLAEQYRQLDSELVTEILSSLPEKSVLALTELDKQTLHDFILKHRQLDQCAYGLSKYLVHYCVYHRADKPENFSLLVGKLLQRHSIKKICDDYNLTGKKQLHTTLIQLFSELKSSVTV